MFGTSSVGTSVVAIFFFTCFGRSLARVCSLISNWGEQEQQDGELHHVRKCGTNFGGSIGAEVFTRVCRGCVGWEGSVKMRWRG